MIELILFNAIFFVSLALVLTALDVAADKYRIRQYKLNRNRHERLKR